MGKTDFNIKGKPEIKITGRPELTSTETAGFNNRKPGAYILINGQLVPDLSDKAMAAKDAAEKAAAAAEEKKLKSEAINETD